MNPNWKTWFEDQPSRGGVRVLPLLGTVSDHASELCLSKDTGLDSANKSWQYKLTVRLSRPGARTGLSHDIILNPESCHDWESACEEAEKEAAKYLSEISNMIQDALNEIESK